MSQTIRQNGAGKTPPDAPGTTHGITSKGLKRGQLGLLAVVVMGISSVAPAVSLTSSLGPAVNAVGLQLPAIFIVAFIPMILVAFAYRELNADSPDSGTTFTWATKAFGPFVGWLGGWGLLAANIIVLSNLAGVAVDFFYLFLAQLFGNPDLASLTSNKLLNISTCLLFVALAVWISYRGLHATKLVQYTMVGFQVVVLGVFVVMALTQALSGGTPTALAFNWDWFNPAEIATFQQFAGGMSLAVFVYWGWDVCLAVNEETKGGKGTAGKAGTTTAAAVLGLYILVIVATMMVAGIGSEGIGLNNPDNQSNIFTALASPVMGPLAILMSLAVLAGTASSLQSTMASPARSLLAMAHYGALPHRFANVSKRFGSPGFATIVAGLISGGFYAVMKVVSENVLNDTILALGLMICFYYALTAFACTWYFRYSVFSSVRNFFMRLLFPVMGGLVLTLVFLQTAVDSWSPDFGSGSEVFGVGLVFILGVGILALGAVFMVIMAKVRPGFFHGETLRKDTPALVVPD
ncbi:amino acid transporter [Arthrobacter sp. Leaf141]|uniref:APC family permease n=1 Tax=Arthrobacter sp. Leaf141 TaxID=1736273 RepID=UPI0007005F09|nr:APC family permease [Arthrobacter sp. Leaf141]KQR00437.1 amino acid transporter [Arthrobacter sp. Leaf141]